MHESDRKFAIYLLAIVSTIVVIVGVVWFIVREYRKFKSENSGTTVGPTDGTDGADGKSAYEIYLEANPGTTREEFEQLYRGNDGASGENAPPPIDGLHGPDGLDGLDGRIGRTGSKGPTGFKGPSGPVGPIFSVVDDLVTPLVRGTGVMRISDNNATVVYWEGKVPMGSFNISTPDTDPSALPLYVSLLFLPNRDLGPTVRLERYSDGANLDVSVTGLDPGVSYRVVYSRDFSFTRRLPHVGFLSQNNPYVTPDPHAPVNDDVAALYSASNLDGYYPPYKGYISASLTASTTETLS